MTDQHWDEVYTRKASNEVSWYRPHLEQSLKLIDEAGLTPEAAIIDVRAGASTLVDARLGYRRLSMLDLSERGLDVSMTRLQWLVGDVTTLALPEATYDVWHDRAVFHFLTDPEQRARYVEAASSSPPSAMRARAPAVGSKSLVMKKASCTPCSATTSCRCAVCRNRTRRPQASARRSSLASAGCAID